MVLEHHMASFSRFQTIDFFREGKKFEYTQTCQDIRHPKNSWAGPECFIAHRSSIPTIPKSPFALSSAAVIVI